MRRRFQLVPYDPRRQSGGTRFVPAPWLLVAFGIARAVLKGGVVPKLGIATLVWSVTPRKLKLVAAGMVLWSAILALGALAAIALLLLQIS